SQAETYVKSIVKIPTPAQQAKGITRSFSTNYQTAYNRLRQGSMSDQAARTLLDSYFPKGTAGRGWLTNEQQNVLKKYVSKNQMDVGAGQTTIQQAKPYVSGGFAYLSPAQARNLQANGQLPAGKEVDNDTGPKIKGFPPGTKLWA